MKPPCPIGNFLLLGAPDRSILYRTVTFTVPRDFWPSKLLIGNIMSASCTTISSVASLGDLVQRERKAQRLTQLEIAGLAHTGNRFIVDLENGKPTIQLQKALGVLELLGLELCIQKKGAQ